MKPSSIGVGIGLGLGLGLGVGKCKHTIRATDFCYSKFPILRSLCFVYFQHSDV